MTQPTHSPAPVQLTQAATRSLSRRVLFAILVIYALAGLFGRDPWKNDDAAGFGVIWTMAHGDWIDWLQPNIVGRPEASAAPLAYWPGAAMVRLAGDLIGDANAARLAIGLLFGATCALLWYGTYLLGRRAEVQPFAYVFGGHPDSRAYGRTLADGALLVLLACAGLALRIHETTPEVTQLALATLLLYGLIRSLDRPRQGAIWVGLALGGLGLAGSLLLVGLFATATLAMPLLSREMRAKPLWTIALPLAVMIAGAWPLWMKLNADDPAIHFHLLQWLRHDRERFALPTLASLSYLLRNLPLFAWPAWPLAIWSWLTWRGMRRYPHLAIASGLAAATIIQILLQRVGSDSLFVLMLPPLAVLAAFGLPTLRRGAINLIDWFALLCFTLLGGIVWLGWFAAITGKPAGLAQRLHALLPNERVAFDWPTFVVALAVSAAWIAIVRWRTSRAPKALWRCLVISSAGTTLLWVLLMTLWLPTVDRAKTYRAVVMQAQAVLPDDYRCIEPLRLGDAQLASFAYFGGLRFGSATEGCDLMLRQDAGQFGEPGNPRGQAWTLLWEGHRASDTHERFRLYQLHDITPDQTLVRRPRPRIEPLED